MISVLYNRKDLGGVKDEKRGQKMGILLWGAGYPSGRAGGLCLVYLPARVPAAGGADPRQRQNGAYSGAELTLETTGYQLYLTFSNFSDVRLESGASVDREGKLLFDAGLAVLLDGQWYWVPHKEYDTAGVGLEVEPGDTVQGQVFLSPYGKLPTDSTVTFGYWHRSSDGPLQEQDYYESYAQFRVEGGRYIP